MKNAYMSPMRYFILLTTILSSGIFIQHGYSGETKHLNVVTSLFPQYDFAKRIGGDKVTVSMLLQPGSDPHAFDPKPSDMMKIANADLFVYTGANMEPWAEKLLESIKDSGKVKAVDVSTGVKFMKGDAHDDDHDTPDEDVEDDHDEAHHDDTEHAEHRHEHHHHAHELDPHIWLDPILAIAMTDNLLHAMCKADPDNASYYTANAAVLVDDLRKIDAECRAMVSKAQRRTLVFGGKFAFAYFTERYGLEHIGAYDSCGSGAEPTVKRILEITEYVRANHIPVIYHEEYVEPKICINIADTTGCRYTTAHSLHNLTAEEFAAGITFVEIMRRNVAAFAEGLQ